MNRQNDIENTSINMSLLLRTFGYNVQWLMLNDKDLGNEILNTAIFYLLRIKCKDPNSPYVVFDPPLDSNSTNKEKE